MSEMGSEVERIAALLQELGYRAKPDKRSILTAMSGMKVLVFVFPSQSIQMYLGISLDPDEGFDLEQANEFNQRNRFAKCYISNATVRFEQDFYFDASQPDAKQRLEWILASWEASIGLAQEALREAARLHGERAASSPAPAN
jgi:hypothetical protein